VEFLETVVEDIVATDPEDPEALVFEVPWLAAGVGALKFLNYPGQDRWC
jgi:hypothetical protein